MLLRIINCAFWYLMIHFVVAILEVPVASGELTLDGETKPMANSSCSGCCDSHEHCSSWANSGECLKNERYMLSACKKSCGLCSTATTNQISSERTAASNQGTNQEVRLTNTSSSEQVVGKNSKANDEEYKGYGEREEDVVYDPTTEPAEDVCRRNPMWNKHFSTGGFNSSEAFELYCRKHMGWRPRDFWWKKDTSTTMSWLKSNHQKIGRCLDESFSKARQEEAFPWTLCNESDKTAACKIFPTRPASHYQSQKEGDIVMVQNVLTEQEAFGLESLAACMHIYLPKEIPFYEINLINPGNVEGENLGLYGYGGNTITLIQGMLQLYLPSVTASVHRALRLAYKKANWGVYGWPDPDQLGLHTAEYMEYSHNGRIGTHTDTDSVYTISVALSNEKDYHGGYFRLESDEVLFKAPRLSSVVFFSDALHGVTEVVGGDRRVLVMEYWVEDDCPVGVPRPDLAGFIAWKRGTLS